MKRKNSTLTEIFCERIADHLAKQKITVNGLAKLTGIAQPTLARYVSGVISPRLEDVERIADALLIDTDLLIGKSVKKLTITPQDAVRTLKEYFDA